MILKKNSILVFLHASAQSGRIALTHLGLVIVGLKKPPSVLFCMEKERLFWKLEIVINGGMFL